MTAASLFAIQSNRLPSIDWRPRGDHTRARRSHPRRNPFQKSWLRIYQSVRLQAYRGQWPPKIGLADEIAHQMAVFATGIVTIREEDCGPNRIEWLMDGELA